MRETKRGRRHKNRRGRGCEEDERERERRNVTPESRRPTEFKVHKQIIKI